MLYLIFKSLSRFFPSVFNFAHISSECQNQTLLLGHVLPLLVSEYGTGFKEDELKYAPLNDWRTLRGVMGKLMQFMDRADRLLKVRLLTAPIAQLMVLFTRQYLL